ncbi:MAG: DUF535 family protein [Candidatus Thiodiazotropha sp.]
MYEVFFGFKDLLQIEQCTVSHYRTLVEAYPEAIPKIFWPYQCKSWNFSTRIDFLYKNNTEGICAIAGAIQGRRMDNITDLYRDMTRRTYGIRPRDMMVEVFQIVCRLSGVEKIHVVAESHRQHKHQLYRLKIKHIHSSLITMRHGWIAAAPATMTPFMSYPSYR